jgi:formiminotetrahydrofolate cyclodeaminase
MRAPAMGCTATRREMEDGTTTHLRELTVSALIDRLDSSDPVPGGGSAAAIAGAMGAALVGMVVSLTTGRPGAEEHEEQLAALRASSADAHDTMLDLAQRDSVAYQSVVTARRLPRETDEQRQARREAVGRAMHDAAEAPLLTARLAVAVLEDAAAVAPIGNVNAASDAGVAALLAWTALRGAILNVRINLPYLAADDPLKGADRELNELQARGDALRQATEATVDRRLGAP